MNFLVRKVDELFGRGAASTTVPILDGRLKPNNLLDDAEVVAEVSDAEDMIPWNDGVLVAAGKALLEVTASDQVSPYKLFDKDITAVCACGDGAVAVALAGSEVCVIGGRWDGLIWKGAKGGAFHAVNALTMHEGRLFATDGSARRHYAQWRHDLMELGRTGRLVAMDEKGAEVIRSGLHYAFGVCDVNGSVWFSESWRHRVDKFDPTGHWNLWDRLPGYPCRMSPASSGGVWLSVFARRTQLIEFVLREAAYRHRMMATIDPDYWIAPALASGESFLEPRQAGGIRQMGVLKPWAPPRSYGLVVQLSKEGLPRLSLHSRVGGRNHGVVATAEVNGSLYVLSKGGARLLKLSVEQIERESLK